MSKKSERRAHHAVSCQRKHGHPSREAAERAMHALARNRGARLADLRVYRCASCKLWHFGNLPGTRRG